MRALVLALALLAVLLAAAAPRGASASAARLARVSARVSAAEAALAEALADAAEAGGAPADAAPADAAAAPEAGTSATMGAGLQLDGDSVAGPDAPVQVGPDTRRIRPGANMPSAIRRRRPRVPDRVFTADAPPATVTGQFGRGKLTVIRNENDFVTKVRQSDDTKAQEAAVKVQAVTEQSTKTAERMDRYTAERRVQARLALAKEKLEAEAEAAEKKVQQEKQQMQEAKLKEQLAAREKAAREEAEKHDAIATTQIRLRAEDSFCLGAQRSVRAAGTPLVLELCDPSVSGQLWKLHPDQTVRLAVDRKWCLALPSAASGQRPVLAPCETDKSQMWRRMSDATLRLVAAPALAVTAKDGVARPGQHAEMREVQPFDASAEFDLAAPGAPGASPLPRVVALRDQFMRDWCAAPERSALDPSARAVVAKTVFSQAQLWLVHPTDFTVRAAGRPSLCLQVRGGKPDQGAPLELGSCSSRPEDFQRWTLDRDGFLRMRDYPQWVAEIAGSGRGMPDQGFQLQVGAVAAARTKWQQWTLLEAPANNQIFGTF